ncbi:hypothetical protein BCV69DRAFT_282852 [Microstroma glucosiphilum]|uniref:Ras GEF n=1 Tax=Pseudomicrostroma glucosiphilum TaxID=1684307 RepID=A0A316U839_9BASI|nr:hypothetical protein BCV69DRAFT_282852 [Pseudomicrostroma glucosiphilum]PWN20631.1 hypothetical protein BCV69DRAFT_282852 [Pseudomicrostroma glucosiphilum]
MLRRNKKKEQQAPPAASGSTGPLSDADPYATATSPHSTSRPATIEPQQSPTSSRTTGSFGRAAQADLRRQQRGYQGNGNLGSSGDGDRGMPSSGSAEAMPPPGAQSSYPQTGSGMPSSASTATFAQPQSTSRSGGALGFIFSKAKNTFAGSSSNTGGGESGHMASTSLGSSSGMPASSTSMASLASLQEDGDFYRIDPRAPGMQNGAMSSPSKGSRPMGDDADSRQRGGRFVGSEAMPATASSPTSKGFFSRDRKTSVASTTRAHAAVRGAGNGSSNASGHANTGSLGGGGYGQFSRSQADLTSRREYDSPASMSSDLPRMPFMAPSKSQTANSIGAPALDDRAFLRSPSPRSMFSRSADELAPNPASLSPNGKAGGLRSPSPQMFGQNGSIPLGSGIVAFATPDEQDETSQQPMWIDGTGRTLQAGSSHSSRAVSPSGSKGEMAVSLGTGGGNSSQSTQMAFSYGARAISPSPESKASHNRTGSKFATPDTFFGPSSSGKKSASRGMGHSGGLSTSFSLTNVAAGASNVIDRLRGPGGTGLPTEPQRSASLPPGVVFQGLLNRNMNVAVPLSQLGGQSQREKDVSKGWKPYKVLLKDGQMMFFKPPGQVIDEVKDLFPSSVVRQSAASVSAQEAVSRGLGHQNFDAAMLKQSGLGTQDLLNATKARDGSSLLPMPRSIPSSPVKKSPLASGQDEETHRKETSGPTRPSWHREGKHKDLELSQSIQMPASWPARIQSGSFEALVHEFVFASQSTTDDDPSDAAHMLQTVLYVSLANGKSIRDFLVQLKGELTQALVVEIGDVLQGQKCDSQEDVDRFKTGVRTRVSSCCDLLVLHHADGLQGENAELLQDLAKEVCGLNFDVNTGLGQHSLGTPGEGEQDVTLSSDRDDSKLRSNAARPKLASLAQGHLSGSDLLSFEPADVATQIQAFHCDRLRALAIPRLWVSTFARREAPTEGGEDGLPAPSFFGFSGAQPHYLTRLVLDQLVGRSAVSKQHVSSTAAKHRAALLRHWIAVASYLLSFGDILGWAAIMVALCSRAVARLQHSWRYVAEGDRILHATSWTPKLAKLGWSEEGQTHLAGVVTLSAITSRQFKDKDGRKQQPIPFFGDSLSRIQDVLGASSIDSRLPFAPLTQEVTCLYDLVGAWFTDSCQSQPLRPAAIPGVGSPVKEFQHALQTLAAGGSVSSVSSYLATSVLIEPCGLGNLDLHWRPSLPPQLNAKALIPLMFPEALPTLDLLNREDVVNILYPGMSQQRRPSGSLGGAEASAGFARYVRSPLGGAPLKGRSSPASLRRTRTYPAIGTRNKSVPFGDISEWAALADRGAAPHDEGTVFRIGSDLVLKATEDAQLNSSSGSPMLSNARFSQELSRSRPLSQMSKRSSLPASQRSSMVDAFVSVQVVVKAASLERLVDILVLGVSDLTVTLSDDNGEIPLQSARRSKLSMDVHAFRTSFLATYRSTCTPIVLFEFLRKRFLAAVNAAKEMSSMPQGANTSRFPSWSMFPVSSAKSEAGLDSADRDYAARVRSGVVSILTVWTQRHTQDFLDFPELLAAFDAFIGQQEESLQGATSVTTASKGDTDLSKAVAALQEVASTLRVNMLRINTRTQFKLEGPPLKEPSPNDEGMIDGQTAIERGDFDAAGPLQIVEHLECVASVFFDKISEKDLLMAAELFERQATDPLGWHVNRESGAAEPQMVTMYKLLESLTPQDGDHGVASLSQKLPASIRDACSAHSLLRGWVAVHIIEQRIGLERRQSRIEKLLDAIWICRARMLNARSEEVSSTPLSASAPLQDATVGSFVESVIVGSLTAPESRTFVRAWQGVCHSRGGTGERLEDLIPASDSLPTLNAASASQPSTPDVGWLLRSLAQAVSRKSPLALADSTLVDFERSQIVFNLIESSFAIRPTPVSQAIAETASARLAAMQLRLRRVHWDRRTFREEAAREALEGQPLPSTTCYRAVRPLQKITVAHAEKQRRDRAAFDSLRTAAMSTTASSQGFDSSANSSAPVTRSPGFGPQEIIGRPSFTVTPAAPGPAISAEKRSRRVTALFRGAVRGTTGLIASGNDKTERTGAEISQRSAGSLLNLISTNQKPASVINLAGARVALWQNTQRSYTFHVSAQDGDCYLLQAATQDDANEWLNQVSKTIREAPVSRTGHPSQSDSKKGGSAALLSKSKSGTTTAPTHSEPFYGVELKILADREGRSVPLGLERMLAVVEARGLKEQGIYRISGAKNAIEGLKQALSTQAAESVNFEHGEFSDVHTIAGAIKQWYRELPEPVVPFAFYHRLIAAEGIESHDERLYAIRDVIWEFPRHHFQLLQRTAEHLGRVADEAEFNKMQPHNLGLVFGTSLLNPAPSATSIAESFGSLGKAANVVKLILTFHDWLFEPEAAADATVEEPGDATVTGRSEADTEMAADDIDEPAADTSIVATSVSAPEPLQTIAIKEEAVEGEDAEVDAPPQESYRIPGLPPHDDSSLLPAGQADEDLELLLTSDASADTDRLLAQLQAEADADAAAAAAPNSPSAAVSASESQAGLAASTTSDSEGGEMEVMEQPEVARRRKGASQARRSMREESVYADALEVALDSTSVTRASLLPDEAMLDMLRMMGASELQEAKEDGASGI